MARPAAFDDRTLTLLGTPQQLARLADLLASPTRLDILRTLRDAKAPLHINGIARRIGVDASPVRTHLELLLKEGLVTEVAGAGRQRNFTTTVDDVRLVVAGGRREPDEDVPKEEARLIRRLEALARKQAKLEAEAAELRRGLATARRSER